MKFNLEIDHEVADGLLIAVLQDSARRCIKIGDDESYIAQYVAAANFVIEHFGGKPVTKVRA